MPEEGVLREAERSPALVEPRRVPALHLVVLGHLGVDEEERHAADVHAPHLEPRLAPEHGYRELERLAVDAHARHRHRLRVVHDPVLELPSGGVEALPVVAAAVQEPDCDHRQPLVGRLLERVAGEHPEPARVDGERGVDAVLGAHVRDRPLQRRTGPRRLGELGGDLHRERQHTRLQLFVALRVRARGGPEVGEELHRVPAGEIPAVRVYLAEDVLGTAEPAPAVVVGDRRERLQAGREVVGEVGRTLRDVRRAGSRREVCAWLFHHRCRVRRMRSLAMLAEGRRHE